MRRLILDTETTGLDFNDDRIIEVACLEIIGDSYTGKKFHKYYNPDNILINKQAEEIHGLNNDFLDKFETFDNSIDEFIDFVNNSPLIIHNAQFDLNMINKSLERTNNNKIRTEDSICTLEMAKKKFPGSKNNLNALCRRFDIGLESREKHGALTDCFLLLKVYVELIGGKQGKLIFSNKQSLQNESLTDFSNKTNLLIQLSKDEEDMHCKMINSIPKSLWKN